MEWDGSPWLGVVLAVFLTVVGAVAVYVVLFIGV